MNKRAKGIIVVAVVLLIVTGLPAGWRSISTIAVVGVPLFGIYLFLRLIFAIIHRLER